MTQSRRDGQQPMASMIDCDPDTPVRRYLDVLRERSHTLGWDELAAREPARLAHYLAARFEYDVRKGGFAQLIYNMQGECLAEMEDMLNAAHATVAHDHYIRAIRACLASEDDYQTFLASHFTSPNALKHDLQLISLEYLARKISFCSEAKPFLERAIASGCPEEP